MIFISSNEVKNVYFISGEVTNEIYIFFTSFDEMKIIFTQKEMNFLFIIYKWYRRREANLTFCCVMFDSHFCPLAVKYIYFFLYFHL